MDPTDKAAQPHTVTELDPRQQTATPLHRQLVGRPAAQALLGGSDSPRSATSLVKQQLESQRGRGHIKGCCSGRSTKKENLANSHNNHPSIINCPTTRLVIHRSVITSRRTGTPLSSRFHPRSHFRGGHVNKKFTQSKIQSRSARGPQMTCR